MNRPSQFPQRMSCVEMWVADGRRCVRLMGSLLAMWSGLCGLAQGTPLRLEIERLVDGTGLVQRLNAEPGWVYTWQGSADLARWTWENSLFADAGTLAWTNNPSSSSSRRFFRALASPTNPVLITNYQGWSNVFFLQNGIVEAVVVPAAGRVLQFRFQGATNGPFWENRTLYGKNATATSWNTEGGFGGDKAWPSPQSEWNWPPPTGFDGSTNTATEAHGSVTLVTPVDSRYKVRTTRVIELGYNEPVMRIRTIFERTAATTLTNRNLGIWVVSQLRDPVRCFVPVPSPSIFPAGYTQLGSGMPTQFRNTNGFISFTRDKSTSHKLGFDADSLVWIGTNLTLRIDAPRVAALPKTAYPDNGSSTEIYTNPGAPYVEHEFLGPLAKLPVGGRMEFLTTYILFERVETDPEAEARRVLNW